MQPRRISKTDKHQPFWKPDTVQARNIHANFSKNVKI